MSKDDGEDNKRTSGSVINFLDVTKGIEPLKYPEQSNDTIDGGLSVEDAIEMGLDNFNEVCSSPDTKGFIGIIFDSQGQIDIMQSGVLDTVQTLGALEYAKNQLININNQFPSFTEEYFFDD